MQPGQCGGYFWGYRPQRWGTQETWGRRAGPAPASAAAGALDWADHQVESGMRSFEDSHGQHWQAALLDGSYGNIMLVFSPLQAGAIRRRALQVSAMAEAMAMLAGLDEDGLRAMLLEADPWEPGVDGF